MALNEKTKNKKIALKGAPSKRRQALEQELTRISNVREPGEKRKEILRQISQLDAQEEKKPLEEEKTRREQIFEDIKAGVSLGEELIPTGSTGRLDVGSLEPVEKAQRDRAIQKVRSESKAAMRDLAISQAAVGVEGGAAAGARAQVLASAGQDIAQISAESGERSIQRDVEQDIFNIEQANKEKLAQLGVGAFTSQLSSGERSSTEAAELQKEATRISSGGGKVICTELYRQGYMSEDIFILDRIYGQLTAFLEPDIMRNYHKYAKYVVSLMRKSKLFTKCIASIVNKWALHMASEIMPNKYSTDKIGQLIHRIGKICLKK